MECIISYVYSLQWRYKSTDKTDSKPEWKIICYELAWVCFPFSFILILWKLMLNLEKLSQNFYCARPIETGYSFFLFWNSNHSYAFFFEFECLKIRLFISDCKINAIASKTASKSFEVKTTSIVSHEQHTLCCALEFYVIYQKITNQRGKKRNEVMKKYFMTFSFWEDHNVVSISIIIILIPVIIVCLQMKWNPLFIFRYFNRMSI